MSLKEYKKKRNFQKTAEPIGTTQIRKKKNLFVVQYHRARREHFDLRLEYNGVLLSWAVPKVPSYNPKDKRLAVKVEDHPIEYADFEGIIPKGEYGGGSVLVWDKGTFEAIKPFKKGLKDGVLKFRLFGERMNGGWTLIELKDKKNWLLIKENDEFENFCDLSKFETSILTGRDSKQIVDDEDLSLKENPFSWVDVELATLVEKIPVEKDWLFEIKYDGYRIVSYVQNGKVRFFTRNKKDFTSKFKALAKEIEDWAKIRALVLDGEMVVLDEKGRSDFQALQNFLKSKEEKILVYIVFDLLALDGKDLREVALIERKIKLKELLKNAPENVVFSEHVQSFGQECFSEAKKMGFEGIVGKCASSKYVSGKNGDWIKIKCRKRQEFVVGGYVSSEKKDISSLLVGAYNKDKLIFYGKVGTGFNSREEKKMLEIFDELTQKKCPFVKQSNLPKNENVFWLRPNLVAEIEFAQLTSEGLLRQASFKGFREDKLAKEVVFEKYDEFEEIDPKTNSKTKEKPLSEDSFQIAGVEISSPDKVLYKDCGVTKADVAKYYFDVSKHMLKFAKNRVLSVVRCHGENLENVFFKKHPNTKSKGVKIVEIKDSEGQSSDYFCVENESGIISEVQLGTIEFHTWGSTIKNLEKPDVMVFDLDPDEGLSLEQVRQGVKDLKKVLESLNLKSFLKTSGGKGYHIVVPFKPSVKWDKFHDFAEKVANFMENKWPDKYTSNMRKDCRKGKIFIDWVRNGRGATSIAPYSLRARKGATVSMPIFWSELDKIAPNEITIFNARERLRKKDPWSNFFKIDQQLK